MAAFHQAEIAREEVQTGRVSKWEGVVGRNAKLTVQVGWMKQRSRVCSVVAEFLKYEWKM